MRRRRSFRRQWEKRTDPGYEEFRQAVLERDNYCCQMPGCKYKNRKWLQVHHIVPYANAYHLRTIVNNGITLCYKCHKRISKNETHYTRLFLTIVEQKNGQ